jgi:hypothetical protein
MMIDDLEAFDTHLKANGHGGLIEALARWATQMEGVPIFNPPPPPEDSSKGETQAAEQQDVEGEGYPTAPN